MPAGGSGWPDDRSPFPGLRPFDTDQHRVFFGRSREVTQLAALLRSPAERVEAGCCWWWARRGVASRRWCGPGCCRRWRPSRAGGRWRRCCPAPIRWRRWPGSWPPALRAVGLGLVGWPRCGAGWIADGLAAVADELLLAAPGPRRTRLLVVIDQFEELLTQAPAAERARFAAAAAAGAGAARCRWWPRCARSFSIQLLLEPGAGRAGAEQRLFAVRPLRAGGAAGGDRGPGPAGRDRHR